ncbi:TonB-dependent receptor [Balneolaceae bacterium YR4-1]|uniref:TonB-dependent receptor n=1 Tax=Halalkalibaculum roseum TaxID=2709311 RepID=A0A6M1SYA9_9BACT|nr:TonB-dependent receptor [Halalkalibaculum roseum]NGP75537.1 TonB-dependent receptor [Halalkalibaculum roseum]
MKKLLLTALFSLFSFTSLFAQSEGILTGKVYDEEDNPLPKASVAVYDSSETNIITGVTTDSAGVFSVKVSPGNYVVEISFVSYQSYTEEVSVSEGEEVDLGNIGLSPTAETMSEVYVRAESSQMQMSFDKRVFEVGQDITSLGGSAVEVLDNVPSLATDIDGNLSLRGNQSVRILINGKPSSRVSGGNVDALRSIPANMIKEVEIITNPSSKYSAEGSAGIINIILKKQTERGVNGSFSLGTGLPQEYEGSTNLNYRVNDINFFFNGGIDYRTEPENGSSFQRFSGPDTTYMYSEQTDAQESELDGDLRFGADFYLSENEVLTASAYVSGEREENNEDINYTDYEYRAGQFTGPVIEEIVRDNEEVSNETDFDFNLDYENKFEGDEHKLTADASFDISNETADTDIQETIREGTTDPLFQRISDGEDEKDLRINAEYVRPLGENGKLEAGIRSDTEWMDNSYNVEEQQNGNWVSLPAFNDNFEYLENVNAAFAILGSEWGNFSGQLGLRLENTRIRTEVKSTGQVNDQNYVNLFPSAFLNYAFNDEQSIQVSYSRRLSRPWSRSLIPFVDFDDPRSQFTGNPNLKPEFSNSYEFGYLHYWDSGSLLTSFYYRYRTDVIERITEQNQGVIRIFPINLATEESWGIELSADQEIANALNLSLNANLFRSNSDGSYQGQVFSSEAEIAQGRLQLRWDVTDTWKFQTSMRYQGPRETTQGTREGMTMIDSGISKEFMDGKALISLNVRDLLNAQNFNNTVNTDGNPNTEFYSQREFSWSSRSASLNFQYFFGEQEQRGGGQRGGGDY